jgi:uncharacterized delta-60 repeat protein
MLFLLLTTMMIAAVIATNMQTTQSTPQQNTNRGNPARDGSPPTGIWWAKAYGSGGDDWANSVQLTAGGGYIVAGTTYSFGAGASDALVLELDSIGQVTWQKTYGGTSYDGANSVQQTSDGGYIVAGVTNSFGAGAYDFWVLKLDAAREVTWQKTYGGGDNDVAYSVQQTSDGGYIVAGYTYSFGAGSADAWVLKLDAAGGVTWQKTYGGSYPNYAYSVQQTADGGYILAGDAYVLSSGYDVWVLKLDYTGSVLWKYTYGGSSDDGANSVRQTSDGGYIVAGVTNSFGAGGADAWVLKLYALGQVTWQKTYGGTDNDLAYSVQQTSDGGYTVAGYTYSFGAGSRDVWVLRLGSTGGVTWQKTYGGSADDSVRSVQQIPDGGYIAAGFTYSFGAGGADVWVLKLDYTGSVVWDAGSGASTQTTSATPLDSGVEASPISATTGVSGAGTASTAVIPGIPSVTVTVQSTPDTAPPATIVDLEASSPTVRSITLTWTAPGDSGMAGNATGYVVKYSTSGPITSSNWDSATTYAQSWTLAKNGTKETRVVSGLSSATRYWFAVEAYDRIPNYGGVSNSPVAVTSVLPRYWARTYGGTSSDYACSVEQTVDGGYVVAGITTSFGLVYGDSWVLKLDLAGSVEWQRAYGGSEIERAYSVEQTADGGYIVAGTTYSFGAGGEDFWVLKLDSTGSVEWQRAYGGSANDYAKSVQQTADGGYVVAGTTYSFGAGYYDFWVLKLDSSGGLTWQKTYGGNDDDWAHSVQQTADGGYIVAGYTYSFGPGQGDVWVLKLDSSGGLTWQKAYGGDMSTEWAYSVGQTADGGYVVAGITSFGAGGYDFWVLKLDSAGGVTWQKAYGGSGSDYAESIQQTADGGYIVAGYTYSFGAGGVDFWVLKLDSAGGVTWQKAYGGSGSDEARSVQQTLDGGYIVTGTTFSFGAGQCDVWVVKLGAEGDIVWDAGSGASTKATGVIPSGSSATTSTTSVTPANSAAAVQATQVTPYDTDATVTVQSRPPAPMIDEPSDVTYTVGQTGNTITWNASSQIPDHYTISVDSGSPASYSWDGQAITVSVDGLSVGTYTYNCTVCDIFGRKASSVVQVTVLPLSPTIDQPSAVTYTVGQTGNSITWNPSSEIPDYYTISVDGGSPTSYSWDGGAITVSVDGLSVGTYTYNCTVYDTQGRIASSEVQVTVLPPAPTIDQPPDVTYTLGQTGNAITWNPSSEIPDYYTISVDGGSPTSYSWDGQAITCSVDGLSVGTYTYNCTVYDTCGRKASSVVQVTILPLAPTIDQPATITYTVGQTGNSITWHPSSEIPDYYMISVDGGSPTSYSWDGSAITVSVDGLSVGTYTYNCTVYDTLDRKASSVVQVTVLPLAPTIDQPANITYAFGQTGNAITWHPTSEIPDHYTISVDGGSPTSHSWSGEAITLSVDGLSVGTYIYNCTVYDTEGRTASSEVQVTVILQAPTIDQPSAVTYTIGQTGNAITWHPSSQIPDYYTISVNDGYPIAYSWDGGSITQNVDGLLAGTYAFNCTVYDTLGRSASSEVTVTVLPPAPTIDQPSAVTYTVGQTGNSITWNPSSQIPDNYTISVDDGAPTSYSWDGSVITLSVDGLSVGTYTYNCTVYDTSGRKASSVVQVTVLPLAPIIDQPSNITYIVGSAGNNITWAPSSQIPSMYSITRNGTIVASGSWSGTSITQSVDGLSAGIYIYACTVNDTLGRSTSSSVQVLVLPPAPTIDQPSAITYVAGTTGNNITWHPSSQIPDHYTISVNGSSPTSHSWNGSTITYSVDGLSAGTYSVNCTVYDTQGRSVSSTVSVTVSVRAGEGIPVIIIVGGVAVVAIVVAISIVIIKKRKT